MKRMKYFMILAVLAAAPVLADEVDNSRELNRNGSWFQPQVSAQADQLSYTLNALSSTLGARIYGSPLYYQSQRVAQAAQTFAWNTRYSDFATIQGSFGWLRSEYDELESGIYNAGLRWDGQVTNLTAQARYQISAIERLLYVGPGPDPIPGPGPNPWEQNWQCYAVDNGFEEHGARAHAGYGRNQWEAQQDATWRCESQHGSCRVTSCQIIR